MINKPSSMSIHLLYWAKQVSLACFYIVTLLVVLIVVFIFVPMPGSKHTKRIDAHERIPGYYLVPRPVRKDSEISVWRPIGFFYEKPYSYALNSCTLFVFDCRAVELVKTTSESEAMAISLSRSGENPQFLSRFNANVRLETGNNPSMSLQEIQDTNDSRFLVHVRLISVAETTCDPQSGIVLCVVANWMIQSNIPVTIFASKLELVDIAHQISPNILDINAIETLVINDEKTVYVSSKHILTKSLLQNSGSTSIFTSSTITHGRYNRLGHSQRDELYWIVNELED